MRSDGVWLFWVGEWAGVAILTLSLGAVLVFPFFHALFADLWSGVRAVEAVPHCVVGDGSDVSDLVEECLPIFASVGLKQVCIRVVFVTLGKADHEECQGIHEHQVEHGLSKEGEDLCAGGFVEVEVVRREESTFGESVEDEDCGHG